jgi:hypothetical protein
MRIKLIQEVCEMTNRDILGVVSIILLLFIILTLLSNTTTYLGYIVLIIASIWGALIVQEIRLRRR